jgi:arabinogalactan oligomer/maltooligosaccharide transport system substrate-binding protein
VRTFLTAPLIALAVVAGLLVGAQPANAQTKRLIIWVEPQLRPVVRDVLPANFRDHRIIVRRANMARIGELLDQVPTDAAPDLILIPNELVGSLADVDAIKPVNIPAETVRTFNRAAFFGFRYSSRTYGVPVLRRNVALISNVNLVPTAPKTFQRLANRALTLTQSGRATVPFAVAQGPEGNAFTTYPLFSGLGGYVFGANPEGSLKPNDVGLNNPKFRENDSRINDWNARGLLRSPLTEEEAREAFLSGSSPFWIAGPQDIQRLKTGSFRYRITAVPQIVKGISPAPMVQSWGFAMTGFAQDRKRAGVAQRFMREVLATAQIQASLSASSPIIALPASTSALSLVRDPVLLAFGAAATPQAVPAPNLAQWPVARGALAGAWRDSTAGAEATPARRAFRAAQDAVTQPAGDTALSRVSPERVS